MQVSGSGLIVLNQGDIQNLLQHQSLPIPLGSLRRIVVKGVFMSEVTLS